MTEKAVILSGGPASAVYPLANCNPKCTQPIACVPLITYLFESLKRCGIKEIAVVISGDHGRDEITAIAKAYADMHVTIRNEEIPRGTAGCLKDLEDFVGHGSFLVICGNVLVEDDGLIELLNFHRTKKAVATIAAETSSDKRMREIENIVIDGDDIVKQMQNILPSQDRRSHLAGSGIYVFNSSILASIYEKEYMDIKEQLIPRLIERGISVHAYVRNEIANNINSTVDYYKLNMRYLVEGRFQSTAVKCWTEHGDKVVVGRNCTISDKAHILGPVIIGSNCNIEDNSIIVGPACISEGTHIERDALVRESVVWSNVRIKRGAAVEYSILSDGCIIQPGKHVNRELLVNDEIQKNVSPVLLADYTESEPIRIKNSKSNEIRYRMYLFAKRMIDIVVAVVCLLIIAPLLSIIAVIVKIGTPGPVIYKQKRCGLGGKLFVMYKFRTMKKDAELEQAKLFKEKEIDGPIFKIKQDPRITRIGKILRETSLDEFPQLFNVLKGDMSLVGPRPLVMEEMKFAPSWRDIRLKVKPGITGLWQINGRGNISFHNWIEHDISYVRKQSMWLDIKILVKTLRVVRGIGAR